MIKLFLKSTVFVFGIILLWTAAPSWAAELLKIGVIDLQKCIQQSEAGKKASKSLQDKADRIKKDLEAKREELKKMSEDFNKKSQVLSADAKREREKELIRKDEDLRELVRKKEEEMHKDEYNAMQPLLSELFEVTKKLAKDDGYTLILESKSGVVYFNKPVEEITDKVIKFTNEPKKEKKK
ncbi:MAG: OmpH family outer membrane protein [Deltaproteobacteria bacterium]|nr:OmpH family outer membrane protein [Deltaproteobacteria bacterium]